VRGAHRVPIEIKSGQTLHDDAFAGLRRWLTFAAENAAMPRLVYGGDESYVRSGVDVRGWREA
jgi:hypothetical protein